jgi:hypothetical protein
VNCSNIEEEQIITLHPGMNNNNAKKEQKKNIMKLKKSTMKLKVQSGRKE